MHEKTKNNAENFIAQYTYVIIYISYVIVSKQNIIDYLTPFVAWNYNVISFIIRFVHTILITFVK